MLPEDSEDDEAEVPGLNYPLDYVMDTWVSYRKHGKYPESGAYNDQDPQWLQDMRMMTARFNWRLQSLREKKDGAESLFSSEGDDWLTQFTDE